VCDAVERHIEPDFLDGICDIPLQQRDLEIVPMAAQIELLPESYRPDGVDARSVPLSAPQYGQARAPASRPQSAACVRS
jgi:hypothetical protein